MHVDRRRGFQIRCAEFERQLVIGPRPSLVVEGALSQDEMIVVEIKLRRVIEKHFPHLAVEGMIVDLHLDTELLQSLGRRSPKFEEAVFARKAIWFEQDFVFAVMNDVFRKVLGIRMLAYMFIHVSNCSILRCSY